MHHYKLIISYDGTHYGGWQIQPNAPSIQQHLQDALHKFLGSQACLIPIIGSGRTDAGVHAYAQVAHFSLKDELNIYRLQTSLNGLIPKDIRVKHIEKVDAQFHSRYSAISKEYHYYLHLDQVMNPFKRLYCWHYHRAVDLALLEQAAQLFTGVHDFTAFANESHKGVAAYDPVRELYRITSHFQGGELRLEFEGNGFLYKMVRNIVGTLMDVASKKRDLNDIPLIFESKDRRLASQAAPPQGLFLVQVKY